MNTTLFVGLVVALVFAGCTPSLEQGGENDGVSLRVSPTTTTAGASITLTLRNGRDGGVGYNLCTSGLHRRAGEEWQPVPEDRVCTMELRLLAPGEEAEFPLDLPTDLPSGEYRYETRVEDMATGEAGPVASNTFRVD